MPCSADAEVLRTPDARFENLPGFDFAPHYVDGLPGFETVRVHYLDEGPRAAERTVLCLHGHPTWCYLYRRMIRPFVEAGYRVIAPDLPGFGRSDKPADEDGYGFEALRGALIGLIETLDLADITLVGHDWGTTVGLTLPMDLADRIDGLVIMNGVLATGDRDLPNGVVGWRRYVADNPDLNVAGLMARANRILTFGECRAYAAPFPDPRFKAGVRALPGLIADHADGPGAALGRRALEFLYSEWQGASQIVIGGRDPLIGASNMRALQRLIRQAPKPIALDHAGHFVPEWGDEFAPAVIASLAAQHLTRRQAEAEAEPPTENAAEDDVASSKNILEA